MAGMGGMCSVSGLRRIVNNTLISLLGQVVTWSSTFLLTVAYGRFLGDVKFGELYFASMFVSLIGTPIESGFSSQVTRDVAEKPEKARTYMWSTLLIKITMWVPLYGIMLLLAWILGYDQEQRNLVIVAGITLMSGSIMSTFASLHYAFERTLYPAVGMVIEKGLTACLGFLLLRNGATVQTMAFVLLGGSLLDALWVAFWFFRLAGWQVTFSKEVMRKLLRGSIPFIVYGVLGVIYYRIDTFLLSLMTSAAVIGWYGAGYRLFDTLSFIPNIIIGAVMYPVFSKLSASFRSAMKKAIEKSMQLLLISAIPVIVLMMVAAPNIIGFVYHQRDFDNTIPVLQALAPGLLFLYLNTLFSTVIISTKGEKKIPIMAAAALVFNLGLNLVMIPLYKQIGAALVTSLTELLLFCLNLAFTPKDLLPAGSVKVGVKALVAGLIMALATFLLRSLSIVLLGPIALLVYVGAAALLRIVPRDDVRALYLAIRSRGKGGQAETLPAMADEALYAQITQPLASIVVTQRLAAMMERPPLFEEIATRRLPSIEKKRVQRRQRKVRLVPLEISDDLASE